MDKEIKRLMWMFRCAKMRCRVHGVLRDAGIRFAEKHANKVDAYIDDMRCIRNRLAEIKEEQNE